MGTSSGKMTPQHLQVPPQGLEPILIAFTPDVYRRWTDIALNKSIQAQANEKRDNLSRMMSSMEHDQNIDATHTTAEKLEVENYCEGVVDLNNFGPEVEDNQQIHERSPPPPQQTVKMLEAGVDLCTEENKDGDGDHSVGKGQGNEEDIYLNSIEKRLNGRALEEVLVLAKELFSKLPPFASEGWKAANSRNGDDSDTRELDQIDIVLKQLKILQEATTAKVNQESAKLSKRIESINASNYSIEPNKCAPFYSQIAECYSKNNKNLSSCQPILQQFTKCAEENFQKVHYLYAPKQV